MKTSKPKSAEERLIERVTDEIEQSAEGLLNDTGSDPKVCRSLAEAIVKKIVKVGKPIRIYVRGGFVTAARNLPRGVSYETIDLDKR